MNAVVAEAVAAAREHGHWPRRGIGVAAALLALALVHGGLRLRAVRVRAAAAPTIAVAIVQPNIDQSVKNRARERADYILSRLVPLTQEADRRGVDLVAWPEATYPMYVRPGIRSFASPDSGVPPLARAHLLMGAATVDWVRGPSGERIPQIGNVDFLLSPSLDVLGVYQKHHLVPFGEYVPLGKYLTFLRHVVPSFAPAVPGTDLRVLEFPAPTATLTATPTATPTAITTATANSTADATPTTPTAADRVRLAPMICFDAIFPEIDVAFARSEPEPDILVNPTNDAWYGYSSGPYQFLAIVRMRAIEAGKAGGPARLRRRLGGHPAHRRARAGRARGRPGRPGPAPDPRRAAATPPRRRPALARAHPLH